MTGEFILDFPCDRETILKVGEAIGIEGIEDSLENVEWCLQIIKMAKSPPPALMDLYF